MPALPSQRDAWPAAVTPYPESHGCHELGGVTAPVLLRMEGKAVMARGSYGPGDDRADECNSE
jgi:hypothetical protein